MNAAISSRLYHEDSDLTDWLARLSGEHSVVRRSTMHRAIRNPRDIHPIEGRTEVVVSHTFIGENDDECHGSSHSSSRRTSDILEQEQAELNGRTIVIALILEVQQSSTP